MHPNCTHHVRGYNDGRPHYSAPFTVVPATSRSRQLNNHDCPHTVRPSLQPAVSTTSAQPPHHKSRSRTAPLYTWKKGIVSSGHPVDSPLNPRVPSQQRRPCLRNAQCVRQKGPAHRNAPSIGQHTASNCGIQSTAVYKTAAGLVPLFIVVLPSPVTSNPVSPHPGSPFYKELPRHGTDSPLPTVTTTEGHAWSVTLPLTPKSRSASSYTRPVLPPQDPSPSPLPRRLKQPMINAHARSVSVRCSTSSSPCQQRWPSFTNALLAFRSDKTSTCRVRNSSQPYLPETVHLSRNSGHIMFFRPVARTCMTHGRAPLCKGLPCRFPGVSPTRRVINGGPLVVWSRSWPRWCSRRRVTHVRLIYSPGLPRRVTLELSRPLRHN